MNTYEAIAKYIRVAPRKLRLVADSVRGLSPIQAVSQLSVTPKHAAKPLASVIQSALANAKEKHAIEEDLILGTVDVQEGPVMKRWRAVSRGRAHGYKKRMSHIKVVLKESKSS